MLEQGCNYSKQCRNNVSATLCWAVLRIASCNVNFKPIGFYAVLDAVALS